MTAPDFMPVLGKGAHDSPKDGACVMEYVSILAGERFSDHPACSLRWLTVWAQTVNDFLPEGERQKLVPLIPRLINTAVPNPTLVEQALEAWAEEAYPPDWVTGTYTRESFQYYHRRHTVEFLTAALDKYDELTGRVPTGMTPDALAMLEAKRQEMAR